MIMPTQLSEPDDEEIFLRPPVRPALGVSSDDDDDDETFVTPSRRPPAPRRGHQRSTQSAPSAPESHQERVKIYNDTLAITLTAEEFVVEDSWVGIAISATSDSVHVDLTPEAAYSVECRGKLWHCLYFGPMFMLRGMRMFGLTIVDSPVTDMPHQDPEDEPFEKHARVVAGETPTEDGEPSNMVKHGMAVNPNSKPVFSDERLCEIADTESTL